MRRTIRKFHRWLALPFVVLILTVFLTRSSPVGSIAQPAQQSLMLTMAITGLYLFLLPWWTKWDRTREKETMMETIETDTMREVSITGTLPRPLLDAGEARALLLNLDAGQAVAPCQMPFLVLYYFIEGQGLVSVERQQAAFHPGSLTAVPAGAVRFISAELPTRVLILQVP